MFPSTTAVRCTVSMRTGPAEAGVATGCGTIRWAAAAATAGC